MSRSDGRLVPRPHSRALSSKVEREIKLSVDPNFRLPRLSGEPLPRRLLTSVYYDTESHDLAHARITLRRRVERGKAAWADIDPQFLLQLARERLLGDFLGVDLAAGKFPEASHRFPARALGDQHPSVEIDDRRRGDQHRASHDR